MTRASDPEVLIQVNDRMRTQTIKAPTGRRSSGIRLDRFFTLNQSADPVA